MDERGVLDLDDASKTENTRAAYKLEQIANALPTKRAGHPRTVVFLTADAFGILPPLARLTRDQALYWFLSGFTAKLAGTEIGVQEPQPTFSACFGAPFLPAASFGLRADARREARPPRLDGMAREHRLDGRSVRRGAPHADPGDAGAPARSAVGLARRRRVPDRPDVRLRGAGRRAGVQSSLLDPRLTWADPSAYDAKALELAQMFRRNFERFEGVSPGVAAAGPLV